MVHRSPCSSARPESAWLAAMMATQLSRFATTGAPRTVIPTISGLGSVPVHRQRRGHQIYIGWRCQAPAKKAKFARRGAAAHPHCLTANHQIGAISRPACVYPVLTAVGRDTAAAWLAVAALERKGCQFMMTEQDNTATWISDRQRWWRSMGSFSLRRRLHARRSTGLVRFRARRDRYQFLTESALHPRASGSFNYSSASLSSSARTIRSAASACD